MTRSRRHFWPVLLPAALWLSALPACDALKIGKSATPSAYRQLRDGQTEAQVTETLGRPRDAAEKDGVRTLTWDRGGFRVTAEFREGKLVSRKALLDGLPLVEGEPESAANDPPRAPTPAPPVAPPAEAPPH
jgi:hypothetical protein